jgi:hypothetical protein
MAPVPLTMGAPDADSQGATYSSWVIIAPESMPFGGGARIAGGRSSAACRSMA